MGAQKFSEEPHIVCTEWNTIICGRIRTNKTKQCIEFSKNSKDVTHETINAVWKYYRQTHPFLEQGAACSEDHNCCLAVYDTKKWKLVRKGEEDARD